jgi:hypothetical protein
MILIEVSSISFDTKTTPADFHIQELSSEFQAEALALKQHIQDINDSSTRSTLLALN